MTNDEYERMTRGEMAPPSVSASDLRDKRDRTLLYGYTCDRKTHHVYIMGGVLNLVVYTRGCHGVTVYFHVAGEMLMSLAVPDKRLYPERCDFEFCRLLKGRGAHLPFTTYDERRRDDVPFHGHII